MVDLLGPTGGAARQSLVALAFNSTTSFIAGATLVGILAAAVPARRAARLDPAVAIRG